MLKGITKAKKAPAKKPVKGEQSLDEFINKRDYTGMPAPTITSLIYGVVV
jgi:hypothetical protein